MSDENKFQDAIVRILSNVEIFKNVPREVLEELSKTMKIASMKGDECVINQGEEGNSMYVIISGNVKVHDKEFTIAKLTDGNFFGEFSLLDEEPRSLSVTTLENSQIGNISQADFYSILNKYPEVTKDIIKVILKRLRNQNQQIITQLREKQKELEQLVKERTSDLRQKNEDLESTLNALKLTQQQLIQQEKLASLGQITAGIAHEIQNPLNFINNFSSISKELAEEIEIAQSQQEKAEIISDLKLNLTKIEEHGKRADSIVKGMLMHTKSAKGDTQLSDIVNLTEQSLSLAYNSLGTNFPDLNCSVEKNIAGEIPKLKIVPQDLSRVMINIFNNAFYALNQKAKKLGKSFVQTVNLEIKYEGNIVSIKITDNGTGIPSSMHNKIFQPFFTTKPTGQGTGLGLSTGYEILKSHGGELKLNTVENEFTEVILRIPAGS